MSNSAMSVVILAAGKGTRMYSDLPKVLHTLAGKPMVQHVIDAANDLGACAVHLVYGHGGDLLRQTLHEDNLNWVLQAEQLGTGHAMQQAAPFFNDDEDILMLYGDVPLISVETLQRLRAAKPQGGIGLLTVKLDDPTGYGRITRENGQVTGIVEHKDASEAQRQIEVIEDGGAVTQETRRWDDVHGVNEVLRSKEDAQDYRYFPDPDLLTIVVDEEHVEELRRSIPELPVHRLQRYLKDYGLPYFDSNLLVENVDKAEFFEKTAALGTAPKSVTNWLLGDVTKVLNEKNCLLSDTKLTPEKLAEMIALIDKKEISNNAGKTVLDEVIFSDKTPAQVVEEKGLRQISDSSFLEKVADEVLAANPKAVEDYKKGKTNVVGFLVGQCMRASKGQGNPTTLREIMEKKLAAL